MRAVKPNAAHGPSRLGKGSSTASSTTPCSMPIARPVVPQPYPLNGRPVLVEYAFARWIIPDINSFMVPLVHALSATVNRCLTPSVSAGLRTTQLREGGRVVAHSRSRRPKRETSATKFFHGPVRRARARQWQPCVSAHVLEYTQHAPKSIRSVNSDMHRTLPHAEKTEMNNCVRLSPFRVLFQRTKH